MTGTEDCPKNNWKHSYGAKKWKGELYLDATWDCYMKRCLLRGRNRVFPLVPRCKNIGEVGRHTPSKEFHRHKHTIPFWSDDLPDDQLRVEYSCL